MIESILVATDGSSAALSAEAVAIDLAKRLGARLRGLTVIDDRLRAALTTPDVGASFPGAAGLDAFLKARADVIAERFAERTRAAGLAASCESAQGRPDDRIVESGAGDDLVVLGRHGQSAGLPTALPGSVTEAVLRKATRSVLVVPSGASLRGPLLLAYDASPGARRAAACAIELARRLGEPVHLFVDSKDKGRSRARFDDVRKLLAELPHRGSEISSTLGRPDAKIVEAAEALGCGLVVMGAFGRNRISDHFLGSNASAVMRTSARPVLLVR
ncbi:MAG TPA: universal stress protein [Myxococcota bacterium]|jgi:nucleotide-binding universal stress UspA family protein|nr:universal stress protein [Myxococcota bacterium]